MNKADTLKFLYRFVDHNRKPLSSPFSQKLKIGNYLCATDGHIIVLVPETEENKIEDTNLNNHPHVDGILPEFTDDITLDFNQILTLYSDVKIITREILEQCESCDGDKKFEHFGNWYDCKECNETGFTKTGRYEDIKKPDTVFQFGENNNVNIKYIKQLIDIYKITKPELVKIVKLGFLTWFNLDGIIVGLGGRYNEDDDDEVKMDIVTVKIN